MAAPPGLSIRERLFLNIVATLETLTVANGYTTEIFTVGRGMQSPLEGFILPCALILPVNDPVDYGAGVRRRELLFTIRLWVDDAPADTASTLEALLADVDTAMAVDVTRGGLAQVTLELMTQFFYVEGTERLCGADMFFQCDYRTALTSPYVSPDAP